MVTEFRIVQTEPLMYCPQCSALHEAIDHFCRKCGTSLSPVTTTTNTATSGDHSFNAGQHNTFTGSINIRSENDEPRAYIDRVKNRPLSIGGHPLKVSWVILSGGLGFASSVVTIWSVFPKGPHYGVLILLAISMVAIMLGTVLHSQRFARLGSFLTFESDKEGAIFLTEIGGECPICDGKLKLRDVGQKEQRTTLVRCTRNPDHFWLFDPTVLGEPGTEEKE